MCTPQGDQAISIMRQRLRPGSSGLTAVQISSSADTIVAILGTDCAVCFAGFRVWYIYPLLYFAF